jgi:hypothetical protein
MPVKYFAPKETMHHWFFPPGDNCGQNNEQSERLLRPQLFIPTVPVWARVWTLNVICKQNKYDSRDIAYKLMKVTINPTPSSWISCFSLCSMVSDVIWLFVFFSLFIYPILNSHIFSHTNIRAIFINYIDYCFLIIGSFHHKSDWNIARATLPIINPLLNPAL